MALVASTLSIVEELRGRHRNLKGKYRKNQDLLERALKTIEKMEKEKEEYHQSYVIQNQKITSFELLYGDVLKQPQNLDYQYPTLSRSENKETEKARYFPKHEQDSMISYPKHADESVANINEKIELLKENERMKRHVTALENQIKKIQQDVENKDRKINILASRDLNTSLSNINDKFSDNQEIERQRKELENENRQLMIELDKSKKDKYNRGPDTSKLITPISGNINSSRSIQTRKTKRASRREFRIKDQFKKYKREP